MYGVSMGTLDVSVNGISVWSNNGSVLLNTWIQAQIDLSSYIGSDIVVEFTGTYGGSYTGDMKMEYSLCGNVVNYILFIFLPWLSSG